MPNTTYLFTLECGHLALAHTWTADGTLTCRVHNRNARVTGVHAYEWHAKCMHTGCSWGRWTGLSQQVAENFASRHIRRTLHRTLVMYEENPTARRKLEEMHNVTMDTGQ
jgi:hypothetical protein